MWLAADPHVRYERSQANVSSRGRTEEDTKSFEEFQAEEAAEMHTSGDSATLNMSGVKDKSDIFLENSHEDLTQFQAHVERELGL